MLSGNCRDRSQLPVKIQCPNCRRTGHATWDAVQPAHELRPALKNLSEGFIHRRQGETSVAADVICLGCGAPVFE